jgi:hypothetical protein
MSDERRLVLSAQGLHITPAEHKAILEIRGLFASNTFHHDPDLDLEVPDGFNMNIIEDSSECGTTCCIAGWMFKAMERDRTAPYARVADYVRTYCSKVLSPLFHPFTDINGKWLDDNWGQAYDFPYELIPPKYALAAIDNFLATGDPDWALVCGLKSPELLVAAE